MPKTRSKASVAESGFVACHLARVLSRLPSLHKEVNILNDIFWSGCVQCLITRHDVVGHAITYEQGDDLLASHSFCRLIYFKTVN